MRLNQGKVFKDGRTKVEDTFAFLISDLLTFRIESRLRRFIYFILVKTALKPITLIKDKGHQEY